MRPQRQSAGLKILRCVSSLPVINSIMIKKSLEFLSGHLLLLKSYIEVRSRLCREIKCPRLAELLQFLIKSLH